VGVASVDKWNAEVDRRERMGGIAKAVRSQFVQGQCLSCRRGNWRTSCKMGVVLWEDLEVTGLTATCVRETLQQNTHSTDYLESSLLVSFAHRHPRTMLTAKHWLGSPFAWMARSGRQ
jgi:hypothetical protein